MELVSTVKNYYSQMTKAEQKVADVFLEKPENFAFSTLDKISRLINVSTTSTIRFCRTIGFDGFKEFQASVQHELKLMATLPDKLLNSTMDTSGNTLIESVIERSVQNIYKTFNEISLETMQQAVNLLSGGHRLFIFGMRESQALSHYAYTRMITIRSDVFLLEAAHDGMVESILNMGPNDTCLFFAFHRYTSLSIKLLPLIRKQGTRIILVTSAPTSEIAEYADVVITCYLDIGSIKNSSIAPVCLMDYFCSEISSRSRQEMLARMNTIEETLHSADIV